MGAASAVLVGAVSMAVTLVATPGWVVVTPPNYGPGLRAGLITAYDSSRLGWEGPPPSATAVSA